VKLTYRSEIDGLRAIAVSAVIFYHSQITILGHQPFKGGFIGVDIFFVISGYLITSIILKELFLTGSFSFKHFYQRRIRRILPAILFVMLASFLFAWIYLLPHSLIDFSKSIFYSLFFGSNFYFHTSGQEYGALSGLLKPFLHTWSLSVEEQFYILFPIIMLITFKYLKKYLIHVLIFGFIISLGLAEWGSRNHPSVSFYYLHTRIWELLAGSILAYFEVKLGYRSKNQTLKTILPGFGLLLIIFNIIFFKTYFPHPSIYTLPSIIGVCLIIWFSHEGELVTKILSSKIFVGVGLISYSLYLWHYPVFAFARITEFVQGGWGEKLLVGVITVILSIASFYLVERPARNSKYKFKYVILILIFFFTILAISSLSVIYKDGFENRVKNRDLLISKYDSRNININKSIYKKCHRKFNVKSSKFCKFGNFNDRNVYLVGDSHAGVLMFDLIKRLNAEKMNLISMTGPGKILKTTEFDKREELYQKIRLKELNNIKDSTIIINGFYNSKKIIFNFEKEIDGYQKLFKYLIKNNNHIILLKPNPIVNNPLWNEGKSYIGRKINIENLKMPKEKYLTGLAKTNEFFDKLNINEIAIIDVSKIFCDKNWCYISRNNNILMTDNDHPSIIAVEMINDLIVQEVKKFYLKIN